MDAFRVWLTPLGSTCRVRVDGVGNAAWLLGRLSQSFVFKNCEPVKEEPGSSCCDFRVVYSFQMSHSSFQRLMAAIPEVRLMADRA